MLKRIFLLGSFLAILILPSAVSAREAANVFDWYIKDFKSEIVVNQDSSLLITEKIIADCGNLGDKHGIFRILPTAINTTDKGKIPTPVELVSITDFSGQPIKYSSSEQNGTVTWKIGDPNKFVNGENEYKIVYKVKNAIRSQADFDELYWNLNGNFWQIETDNFTADIKFPAGLNQKNVNLDYFSGELGSKNNELAGWQWNGEVLHFYSKHMLKRGEGITVSAALPKGFFKAYKPSLSDVLPGWPWIFLPIIVLAICFWLWKKYGQDPTMNKTVIAEYEVPNNLTPMQMGLVGGSGFMDDKFIAATIIQMATDKILTINEVENKILFVTSKDYKLEDAGNAEAVAKLAPAEKAVYDAVFNGQPSVLLSEMKKKFYKQRPDIEAKAKDWLVQNGYMEKEGFKIQTIMFVAWTFSLVALFIFAKDSITSVMIVSFVVSAVLVVLFACLMTKRTPKGAEAAWKIKGFKLFMNTAEKYRAQFYEKENMFEKILPYAIAFGLTKKWIDKMRLVYGNDKFLAMAPLWYSSANGFNVDSFTTSMNSVSSAITSSVSSSSGQGGSGGAGGGGGGGGGGGW